MVWSMAKVTVHIPDDVHAAAKRITGGDAAKSVSGLAASGLVKEVIRLEALEHRRHGWPPEREALDWAVTVAADSGAGTR